MDQHVEVAVVSAHGCGQIGKSLIRTYVARVAVRSPKFRGKFFDLVANAFTLIDETESSPVRV